MLPLSGRLYYTADSKLATQNVGICLHDGEDAMMLNLEIVAQLEPIPIPDFLVHRLRTQVDTLYPDLKDAMQRGALRCDSDLTEEQARQQWADLGLTLDASNLDVAAALAEFSANVTVAAATSTSDTLAQMQAAIAELQALKNPPPPPVEDGRDALIAQLRAELATNSATPDSVLPAPQIEQLPI
jgi:hypothetical protein